MLLLLDIIYCAFLRIYFHRQRLLSSSKLAFLEVSSEQSSSPFPVKNILLDFVPDLLDFLRSSPFNIIV